MNTLLASLVPSFHISGDMNSRHFWREQFQTAPTVTLDGETIDFFCEAKSGPDGFVVVEVKGADGNPRLADVVVDGEVIDQVIAKRTLRGAVVIKPAPLKKLKCRRVPGSPTDLVFTFSHAPSNFLKAYLDDVVSSALAIAAPPEDGAPPAPSATGGEHG